MAINRNLSILAQGAGSANTLSLGGATLGSNALAVTGTTALSGLLTAAGGVSSTLTTDATSTTTGSIITAGGISTQKALWVGTTSRLVGNVQADANIGIGCSPATPLNISGSGAMIRLDGPSTTSSAHIGFTHAGVGVCAIGLDISGGSIIVSSPANSLGIRNDMQGILFSTGGSGLEVARIDTSGRLQVGTTAGTGRINMANSGGGLQQINSTGGTQEILNLFSDNNLYFSAPSNIIIRPGGGGEAARFDTSGNLLVGTTGVTGGLNGKIINVFGSSTVRNIVQTTGQYAVINMGSGGTSVSPTTTAFLLTDGTANTASVGTGTSTPLQFFVNNSERARFDTSGNLLVGTSSTSGSASNAAIVAGGIFKTVSGTTSIPQNTPTVIFAHQYASWLVSASSEATGYTVTAVVNCGSYAAGVNNLIQLPAGANQGTIAISGANVTLSFGGLATYNATWNAVRIQ